MRVNITSDMHATADVLDNIAEWADQKTYPIIVAFNDADLWCNSAWAAAEWNNVKDKERYIALANS